MILRRFVAPALAALAWILPACGGGGGGGNDPGDAGILLTAITVTTQQEGPLSPFGSTHGGDEVVLTGQGFAVGLSVHFGTAPATVTEIQTGRVTVTTPAGREGLVDVRVTLVDGRSSTFASAFRFVAPPVVTGLVVQTGPTTGEKRVPIAGGETVELRGGGFRAGMTLSINSRSVAVSLVDDGHATFVAPAADSEVSYDVVVTNPEGLAATLPRGLEYTQEFSLLADTGAFTPLRARHLFRRAAFGATPTRIDQAVSAGLAATVDGLMTFSNDGTAEADAIPLWGTNPPPFAPYNNRVARQWWIQLMLKNPNPFQERMAWFLHDHFATSNVNFAGDAQFYFYYHVNLMRRFSLATSDATGDGLPGLGYDWKKMLVEMGKDRAMLEWLDGRLSVSNNPNENYARELWELFSLGEGNGYTEDDIQEAAKAFTGFQWFRDTAKFGDTRLEMRYRESRHNTGDKTVFGVTGKFGYDDIGGLYWNESTGDYDPSVATDSRDTDGGIVALTLRERATEASVFICRKLAAFFLYENPHDIVVNELAADLRRFNWNLKPVIRKILLSKAMYSGRATKGQVRNPVEFVLEFMRTANVDLHPAITTNTVRVVNELAAMGQMPLQPPDVSGWPVGEAWLSSQGMVERTNFITFAIEQLDDFDTQIVPLIPPAGQRGPTDLVDHIATVLDVQLSGNARSKAIAYVTSQESNGQTVPFAYDQNNNEHVKMKTRGLLFLIAQYHDAHQN